MPKSKKRLISILIPAYNEEENLPVIIPKVVEAVRRLTKKYPDVTYEIVLVDDGSTDSTFQIAKQLAKKYKHLKVFTKPNGGKTSAIKTAFSKSKGDTIIIQDADLEYDPNDYVKLFAPVLGGKANVVYGNRFGKRNRWLPHSYLANKVLTAITRLLTGLDVKDMEVCYKVFTRNIAERIFPYLEAPRFGLEPEITMRVAQLKEKLVNVPISYFPRKEKEGKKVNVNDFWEALWTLFVMKVFKRYKPMPIPSSFITYTIIGGLAVSTDFLSFWALYHIFKTPYVNIISYLIGTVISFSLNRWVNFKVYSKPVERFMRFVLVSLIGSLWSSVLIAYLTTLGFAPIVAKAMTLGLVLLYQYWGSRIFVFRASG